MELSENRTHQRKLLGEILKDEDYLPNNHRNEGYRNFITSMRDGLKGGRMITPKMSRAIGKACRQFDRYRNPMSMGTGRWMERDRILRKIKQLKIRFDEAKRVGEPYPDWSIRKTEEFLQSIEKYAQTRYTLTMNQMKALNDMYKKFNWRIKKNTK